MIYSKGVFSINVILSFEYYGWFQVLINNIPQARFSPSGLEYAIYYVNCLYSKFGNNIPRI